VRFLEQVNRTQGRANFISNPKISGTRIFFDLSRFGTALRQSSLISWDRTSPHWSQRYVRNSGSAPSFCDTRMSLIGLGATQSSHSGSGMSGSSDISRPPNVEPAASNIYVSGALTSVNGALRRKSLQRMCAR